MLRSTVRHWYWQNYASDTAKLQARSDAGKKNAPPDDGANRSSMVVAALALVSRREDTASSTYFPGEFLVRMEIRRSPAGVVLAAPSRTISVAVTALP